MRTPSQIYGEYKIIPALQTHQLRVASVAKVICDNLKEEVDTDNVVLACLFHDMGNIIKSNFDHFPDFLEPQGREYWQSVKDEYIKKYGPDEHHAAQMIAKEIGLPPEVMKLIERIKFSNLGEIEAKGPLESKICSYSDMRAGPFGVVSIEERLKDGQKRYGSKPNSAFSKKFSKDFAVLSDSLRKIEKEISSMTGLIPEDINDEKIESVMEDLKALRI